MAALVLGDVGWVLVLLLLNEYQRAVLVAALPPDSAEPRRNRLYVTSD